MSKWKAELDAFVDETMAFVGRVAKTRRDAPLLSHTIDPVGPPPVTEMVPLVSQVAKNYATELCGIPPLDVQREEISRRVELFKAHQRRLIRDREDCAASSLKRMWASARTQRPSVSPPAPSK